MEYLRLNLIDLRNEKHCRPTEAARLKFERPQAGNFSLVHRLSY